MASWNGVTSAANGAFETLTVGTQDVGAVCTAVNDSVTGLAETKWSVDSAHSRISATQVQVDLVQNMKADQTALDTTDFAVTTLLSGMGVLTTDAAAALVQESGASGTLSLVSDGGSLGTPATLKNL